jgi:DNA-directed RNA polymerase subunit beta'
VKAIQLLINRLLPEDLRDYTRAYDSKSIAKLLSQVAEKYPERYAEVVKGISDVGRHATYHQGETLTLADLKPTFDRGKVFMRMDAEIAAAQKTAKSQDEFEQARDRIWTKYSDDLEKMTADSALALGNNLAYSVVSGARGKGAQLKAMIATPGIYTDYKDRIIPVFARRSFSEGLRPAEYLASTFGARKSVLSTKIGTAKGGDIGKQCAAVASNLVITTKDCGTTNGIDLDSDDASLRGRVLVAKAGNIPAGTVIDRHVAAELKKLKGKVLVRSAMTCSAEHGLCARCHGARMNGLMPKIGESVGVSAAQALSEPITQGALSSKHTAGQGSGKKVYSGLDTITQIVQTPEVFPDRAEVAQEAGRVAKIEPAPQGGQYVHIGESRHYVHPDYPLTVKVGDHVEAGEQLSDGIIDPSDIVRLRGLGSGRRYYSQRLKQVLDDSGMAANLRNTEVMARAAIDHVVIDDADGVGEFLPDDVVSYNRIAQIYAPPTSAKKLPVSPKLAGQYLYSPALHYTVGTKLTEKMAKRIQDAGIAEVHAAPDAPKFFPQMVRLRAASHHDPDWMTRMSTSYLKANLADTAARGADTNIESNHNWQARLAFGKDFGKETATTGKF